MPAFKYTGRTRDGEGVSGHVEGASAAAVADKLFGSGITPIDISLADGGLLGALQAAPVRSVETAKVFQFTGRNRRGDVVTGQSEALSAETVAEQLLLNGVTPIEIRPADVTRRLLGDLRDIRKRLRKGRVALLDVIFFSRQMYTLLKAGVPILQALRGLRDSAQNPALGKVIERIIEGLDAGLDLTSAVKRHPEVFSPLFVNMVQVGETTGSLPEAFLQLAEYLEREKETRERIKQAMRYPSFVLIAIGIALFIINLFVIPAFATVFSGFKAELPWATQILIGVSTFTTAYWPAIIIGIIVLSLGARLFVRTPYGLYQWHRWKLRLPVVGNVIYRALLGRFARALSMTLKAGVPVVQGMNVVSRAVDNEYIGERISQMREGIERGETITRTAMVTGMFPALVIQMIAVGEETGAVDELLVEVADYYDGEVDYALKNLSAAIEPILIVAMGVIVLILALGVFLPMWDLAKVARS